MILLLILDGWGYSKNRYGNAVALAKTPFLDNLKKKYPSSLLETSGSAVGLPDGQMGGSEVGHLTIGSGRIIFQKLTEINKSIKDKTFFKNRLLLQKLKELKKRDKSLHLLGLFSYGGVHSNLNHLKALIKVAKDEQIKKIYIHAFLDGRDVSPKQAVIDLSDWTKNEGTPVISLMGRFYAMDRDKRWERTEIAYNALVNGIGEKSENLIESLKKKYKKGVTDEFVTPIISSNFKPISDNDLIVFYNFRPDRARQLSLALSENRLEFTKKKSLKVDFLSLVEYDKTFNFPSLFPTEYIKETLAEILSQKKMRQLRIAETEKYAHITYFFNGEREDSLPFEDRILVPSPKISTYDLKPEMSAFEVTDKLISLIKTKKYDFIVLNYANCDMVGHTGKLEPTIKAVEAVDSCLKKIFENLGKNDKMLIIADHGNAEKMITDNGEPFTAHTTNPVPFIFVSKEKYNLENGGLRDIAPTILEIMDIPKPAIMTGKSLLKKIER